MLLNASCKPSLGVPGHVTKFFQAKNGQKVEIAGIDEKWFVIFEHTTNHLSFGYVHLPQLEY